MMDGGTQPDGLRLDPAALGQLMPMYLVISPTGHIRSAGQTLRKICAATPVIGQRFLELFELRRPRNVAAMADLARDRSGRLAMTLRAPPRTSFKGIAVDLGPGQGLLVNLAFNSAMGEAVGEHHLSGADFAVTDQTVDMLYLLEAQTVVRKELRRLNQRLQGAKTAAETLALTDAVTGLCNRRAMTLALDRQIRSRAPFCLLNMDLDFFKQVNDTLGHAAGDHVLDQVARILCAESRGADMVARVGGDEFVLIIPSLTDAAKLVALARRILVRLEVPMMFEGKPCCISASMGTTISTQYVDPDPEQMLADADRALYASKRRGRRQVTAFSPDLDNRADA